MKQETGKKSKKLLWLIIALAAVVAVAGVLLGVFWSQLFGTEDPATTPTGPAELYWNVDRFQFVDEETGMSNRVPGDDGLFTIRYAYNGQIVELKATGDKKLINYIDTLNVMGLILDADGLIVDVVDAKTIAKEVVKDHYVSEAGADFIRVNSTMVMTGMVTKIKITENTKIYDVSPDADPVGKEATCSQLDCVTAYADADGNVTHVFITKRVETGDIYYIFDTKYDSTAKETTRVPDENGVYTITAAHEGAQVELKVRDKAVMNELDAATGLFGLKFDDEGYVIKKLDAASAMLGIKEFVNYTITELDGDTFTATRYVVGSEQGNTYTGTLLDDADVFIVETYCTAEFIGQRTELKMGDRIDLWTDLEGNPKLILIQNRRVDGPLYWNQNQNNYNWTTKETNRKPDENGYYHIELLAEGKMVQLRTKEKDLMTAIDSRWERACGLKLKGDIIQAVYDARCVTGYWSAGTFCYVTAMSGNVIQRAGQTNWANVANYLVGNDCKIFDVSGYYGVKYGSKTTVRKYDCVTLFQNEASELTHIYITDRYVEDAKIYYNLSDKTTTTVDGKTVTTRVADEKGYYVFDMACEGKQVQVKTKDVDLATYIDNQWPNYVALEVKKDGTIKNAYPARATVKGGEDRARGSEVMSINKDGTFETGTRFNGVLNSSVTLQMAEDCVVYNCSNGFVNFKGEKTTLKVGDQFTSIGAYPDRQIKEIYVMSRLIDSPIYWHYNRYAPKTVDGVLEPTRPTDKNGYYVFELIADGKIATLKTKDKALAAKIDSQTTGFTLASKNGIATACYSAVLSAPDETVSFGVFGFDVSEYDSKTGAITLLRNNPSTSDYGQKMTSVLTKNCKIVNVDPNSPNFGKLDKLELGDRVVNYRNYAKDTTYVFIQRKNTHVEGYISYCDHCGEDVVWEPYTGEFCKNDEYAKTTVFHYYIPYDINSSYGPGIGHRDTAQKNYEIVLDLNGKTFNGLKNAFYIHTGDTLTVLDTVGGGKITAEKAPGSESGIICVNGTLNLLSGTICPAENYNVGSYAGVLYVTGADGEINIYGGVVTGGRVDGAYSYGGNIQATRGATVNVYGGTISKGVATATTEACGGNIFLSSGSKLNVYGGTITGGEAQYGGNVAVSATADAQSQFHMEGGTITEGKAIAKFGGNVYITSPALVDIKGGTISNGQAARGGNLYLRTSYVTLGGKIEGGKATTDGANVTFYITDSNTITIAGEMGAPAADSVVKGGLALVKGGGSGFKVVFDGAKISGNVSIPAGTETTLSGKVMIDQLTLPSGLKLKLNELDPESRMVIAADGAFTEANSNAAAYEECFLPVDEQTKEINLKENVFYCEDKYIAPPPVIDYAGKLTEETNKRINAYCAACGAYKTWSPAYPGLGAYVNGWDAANADQHYYLASEFALNAVNGSIQTNGIGKVCLHLNGFNVTNTSDRAMYVLPGDTLNVMGTGTVTGNGTYGATIYNRGTLNLYAGTYLKSDTATDGYKNLIRVNAGTVSIYNNVTIVDNTTLSTIASDKATDVYNIYGGTIQGLVNANSGAAVNLSGNPVITRLLLKQGSKINVGGMTSGALVGLDNFTTTTDRVFSNAPASYAPYFHAYTEGDCIVPTETGLAYAPGVLTTATTATVEAYCPRCGTTKSWRAINGGEKSSATYLWDTHWYLTSDLTYTGSAAALYGAATVDDISYSCIHLNGHNITATAGGAIEDRGVKMHIFGKGTVTGNKGSEYGAAIYAYRGGAIYLYGGTYTKPATNPYPAIYLNNATAMYMYNDATVLGHEASTWANVYLGNDAASFTMNGGTITGNKNTQRYGGNICVSNGTFVMNGGTITGGTASRGGDVYVNNGSATVNGGKIGELGVAETKTVTLAGAPVIDKLKLYGGTATITLGELIKGAAVKVEADDGAVITVANPKVADYVAYFTAFATNDTLELVTADNTLKYVAATVAP